MKKIKKYFKWLTFLSAPLLATSSLSALTSCSSEEPSGSSNSGGNNSGSNGGSNNSGKEIPKGKELLSDLVGYREVTPNPSSVLGFLDLRSDEYNNVAWQYTDGTNIEYKVTIEVGKCYSIYSASRIKEINDYLYASNIDGFKYSFSILKNKNANKFEYKIPQNTNLINSSYYNYVYFLPRDKQVIMLNEVSNKGSALALRLQDNGFIRLVSENVTDNEEIINIFGDKFPYFSGVSMNGQRFCKFNEESIKLMKSSPSGFIDFKNLKGVVNIEI